MGWVQDKGGITIISTGNAFRTPDCVLKERAIDEKNCYQAETTLIFK